MTSNNEPVVDWFLVNQLVAPEHQYQDVKDPPLDAVRMAWPFKTEEERKLIIQWMRRQTKARKIKMMKMDPGLF